ncbi:hypothetical protein CTAYLR_000831 [Chrysophaeum taylorii]|uniref:ETFB lysine methyltransferase n=1 Tax=Chrysophaeum taylorii TaxID=2483200 RepID=A0AAD7UQ15_9STRA|nr:hypothetical protein CTAYLR_000831 [Chrysophaeum taylorii]
MIALCVVVGVLRNSVALQGCHRCFFKLHGGRELFVYAETLTGDSRQRADATASQLWPASRAAARFVAKHIELSRERLTVCELGCGLGAPAISAALFGARAIATDVDERALARVRAAARDQRIPVETRALDVCDASVRLPRADVFVLADVVAGSRLSKAVADRVCEAYDTGALVIVAMDAARAQRADVLRHLREASSWPVASSSLDFQPAPFWDYQVARHLRARSTRPRNIIMPVLLHVDEEDPTLYHH